jgi:oxygen-dependent protoporphyrinogen oxidase
MSTVAIIGGGISGLSIAEALNRHAAAAGTAVETVVLEAESAPGGKITTEKHGDIVVETGPHGFLDKEPAANQLVERLGLMDQLVAANESSSNRYILREGQLRLMPMKPPAFVSSDILTLSGKLRAMFEPLTPARDDSEREETVWEFARRRIGRQAADVLVDAMVTGIYGGDPKKLSVSAAFPRLVEIERKYGGLIRGQFAIAKERKKSGGPKQSGFGGPGGTLHSFRGGLGVLIDALAKRTELRLGFQAERIERISETRFRVHSASESLEADAVVVTVPAYDAANLLRPFAEPQCELLDQIRYVPVAVVVQCFQAEELRPPLKGFGFLVPDGEKREILGSIWASTVFGDHAPAGTVMLRTLLGGSRRPEAAEGDDEALFARAKKELVSIMKINPAAEPVFQRAIRWDRGIPQYELGHGLRAQAAVDIEQLVPGVFLSGNAFRGVAMIQCVVDADRVAPRVLARLGSAA